MDKKAIGRRLRELRGVFRTQAEVSKATGIERSKISRYENDIVVPTDEDKEKFSKYYAVSIEQLFYT